MSGLGALIPTDKEAFLLLLQGELLHQQEVLLLVVAEPLHRGHEGEPDEEVEDGGEPVTPGGSEQTRWQTGWLDFPHLSFFFTALGVVLVTLVSRGGFSTSDILICTMVR